MKFIVVIIISLMFGFIFARYSEKSTGSDSRAQNPTEAKSEVPATVSLDETSAHGTESAEVKTGFIESNPGAPESQTQTTTGFDLTEDLVAELESRIEDLPKQVELKRESGGWKVMRLESGSVFSKTGLKSGDFITDEALKSVRDSNPEKEELVKRAARLLDQISTF